MRAIGFQMRTILFLNARKNFFRAKTSENDFVVNYFRFKSLGSSKYAYDSLVGGCNYCAHGTIGFRVKPSLVKLF
jgi:hypothetical protein